MSFFWPTRTNPFPGLFGRMGQLAHFAAIAVFLLLLWMWSPAAGDDIRVGLLFGIPIYFIGRGVRYMLAGE